MLLANGLPKDTVRAITILYKNAKPMVLLLDGNTDFFVIDTGVFQ